MLSGHVGVSILALRAFVDPSAQMTHRCTEKLLDAIGFNLHPSLLVGVELRRFLLVDNGAFGNARSSAFGASSGLEGVSTSGVGFHTQGIHGVLNSELVDSLVNQL